MESSKGATLKTIITPSKLTINEIFKGADLVVSDLGEKDKPFKLISGDCYGKKIIDLELISKLVKKLNLCINQNHYYYLNHKNYNTKSM